MDTISYTLTSIGLQFVPPSSNGRIYVKMQYAGLLILGLAMYFEGPAVFLPNKIWTICVGLLLCGVGAALVNNNANSAMFLNANKV